jgi:hypothetical protein
VRQTEMLQGRIQRRALSWSCCIFVLLPPFTVSSRGHLKPATTHAPSSKRWGRSVQWPTHSTTNKDILPCSTVISHSRILTTAVRRGTYATCRYSVRCPVWTSVGHPDIQRHSVKCCGYVPSTVVSLCSWDSRFSQRRIWRWLTSEMLHRILW